MPAKKIDKDQIVKTAYQIFRTQGYSRTSMSDIAQACGVFKSGLYHYFSNKEDLMKEVLLWVHELSKTSLFESLRNTALAPQKRLELFFATLRRIHIEEQGGCIFGNIALETSGQNDEFRLRIKDFFDDYIDALKTLFVSSYNPKKAQELAISSLENIEGSLMLARVYKDDRFIRNVHQKISQHVP